MYTINSIVRPIHRSSLPLATLETFPLWFGWFSFNCYSVLAMKIKADIDSVACVFTATNMVTAITAAVIQVLYKKVDLTMLWNCTLAGLVAVKVGSDLGVLPGSE